MGGATGGTFGGADREALAEGARNLLLGCGGLRRGDRIAIAAEDPALGWHDDIAPAAVAAEAERLGMLPSIVRVGGPDAPCPALERAIETADAIVFFARLGDRERFGAMADGRPRIMCYARDAAALASPFGRAPHAALKALKEAVDAAIGAASRIEIACPLGTRVAGAPPPAEGPPADVTIRRFPLGVPAPTAADGFAGDVMLAGWLTSTGNHAYAPSIATIRAPVRAEIAGGRLVALHGAADDVETVRAHHDRVGALFGLDPARVHSWHAGIHPGCAYAAPAANDPDRWSNSVFSNPRFLHFHTCGDTPPGEISWMIADPTIRLDGAALWREGRLDPDAVPEIAALTRDEPALAALLSAPCDAVGL
jgi:hypothetical protein